MSLGEIVCINFWNGLWLCVCVGWWWAVGSVAVFGVCRVGVSVFHSFEDIKLHEGEMGVGGARERSLALVLTLSFHLALVVAGAVWQRRRGTWGGACECGCTSC